MTELTKHAMPSQEYDGEGLDSEPKIKPTGAKSTKEELREILTLIRAHLAFQADTIQFTRQSLAAIRETLAGIESD
jgi:hypothetical protein